MKQICLRCCEVIEMAPLAVKVWGHLTGNGFTVFEAAKLMALYCPGCDAMGRREDACCCDECQRVISGRALGNTPPCPTLAKQGRARERPPQ